ncbi:hypothetical protein C2G38_2198894 [Gigaspora rosea]|uniref:Uncharacterized protein n=1 Tax=Gigaspora rosea TaxID=44941 RepID=A0A397US89_9GLOM|nr:hypothetical protein C2G38_2198894 [Gigaspora rosea]
MDYIIINEDVYPPLHKLAYTKKPEQYAIPDQYIVRTTYGKKKYITECSIQYINDKPYFAIQFDKYMRYCIKKLISLKSLKELKNKGTLSSEDIQEINANTINKNENKKKDIFQPFNDLSNSTQRRHMLTMAKRVLDQVEICKENIFNKYDKVELKQARFTINDKPFEIQYGKVNQEKIDDLHLAVLKSLDKGKISCEAYRSLARINQDLPRDSAISSTRQRLNKQMQNLVPLSFTNIEETSVSSELTEDQPYITDPDIVNNVVESAGKGLLIPNNTTIKLHISEDGRNVGRKVQHVMVTAIILNDIERLYKPEGYHTLVLYSGSENYQSLQNALCTLILDLNNLRESDFTKITACIGMWNFFLVQIGSF